MVACPVSLSVTLGTWTAIHKQAWSLRTRLDSLIARTVSHSLTQRLPPVLFLRRAPLERVGPSLSEPFEALCFAGVSENPGVPLAAPPRPLSVCHHCAGNETDQQRSHSDPGLETFTAAAVTGRPHTSVVQHETRPLPPRTVPGCWGLPSISGCFILSSLSQEVAGTLLLSAGRSSRASHTAQLAPRHREVQGHVDAR